MNPPSVLPPSVLPPSMLPQPNEVPNQPPSDNLTTPFATANPGGGFQGRSFNETFDGDFAGTFYSKTVVVGSRTEQIITGYRTVYRGDQEPLKVPIYGTITQQVTKVVRVPVAGSYNGVMITDNDSPVPMNRTYATYNYYSGLGASVNNGFGINEDREMFGFEQTLLGGNASFGMRLPFIEYYGPDGTNGQTVGDLSLLFKYAFINSPETGNLVSAGMVLTAPTSGAAGYFPNGEQVPHSVLFQPWLGFVHLFDRAYVEGITDFIAPTNNRDTFLWTNSLAAGYWVYRDLDSRYLNGIIPTLELHIHTALNNRNPDGLIYVPDEVNLTAGVHLRFPRATLTTAFSIPMAGPHPYSAEAIVNLNFWF